MRLSTLNVRSHTSSDLGPEINSSHSKSWYFLRKSYCRQPPEREGTFQVLAKHTSSTIPQSPRYYNHEQGYALKQVYISPNPISHRFPFAFTYILSPLQLLICLVLLEKVMKPNRSAYILTLPSCKILLLTDFILS